MRMGEAQEVQLHVMVQEDALSVQEAKEAKSTETVGNVNSQSTQVHWLEKYRWWLKMGFYAFFILSGQSTATLLGRLYYEKGGKSKWVAALVQTGGFPLLLPLLCMSPTKHEAASSDRTQPPSSLVLAALYVFLGLFMAAGCMLFSVGLQYLPVSTFALISASQLGFNAFFSYFLNSQKLTPIIINSVVLLTISAIVLVLQTDSSDSNKVSKGKYAIGFLCSVGGSAGYALMLSLTQLSYTKILKSRTLKVVLNLIIYQSLVSSCAILAGLFASGDWKSLNGEMERFGLGKSTYVMTLVGIAATWQMFAVGSVGLIFEVSSLFCNVISTLGLPIVPVLAVFCFHDKMSGAKVVAMLLAIWGFVSYIYQHYLDDLTSKSESENANGLQKLPSLEDHADP